MEMAAAVVHLIAAVALNVAGNNNENRYDYVPVNICWHFYFILIFEWSRRDV